MHEFQARVNLLDNTDVDVAAGATLEFQQPPQLGRKHVDEDGGGALRINNDLNTGGGAIVVVGGTVGGGGTIGGDLITQPARSRPATVPEFSRSVATTPKTPLARWPSNWVDRAGITARPVGRQRHCDARRHACGVAH